MSQPLGAATVGDALHGQTNQSLASDPVRKLAEYQLLREKLSVRSDPRLSAEAKQILGAESELDNLEINILLKLSKPEYSESTAEYQRLVDLTGSEDKIGIAKWLAQHIYAKARGKAVLEAFAKDVTVDALKASAAAGTVRGGAGGSPAELAAQFRTFLGLS